LRRQPREEGGGGGELKKFSHFDSQRGKKKKRSADPSALLFYPDPSGPGERGRGKSRRQYLNSSPRMKEKRIAAAAFIFLRHREAAECSIWLALSKGGGKGNLVRALHFLWRREEEKKKKRPRAAFVAAARLDLKKKRGRYPLFLPERRTDLRIITLEKKVFPPHISVRSGCLARSLCGAGGRKGKKGQSSLAVSGEGRKKCVAASAEKKKGEEELFRCR